LKTPVDFFKIIFLFIFIVKQDEEADSVQAADDDNRENSDETNKL